ncbi:MAG: hypothetical protein F6K56_21430 [Moorea sp. SIO3G5]|nr:hypothetical protein [Moorena sp. SIO3G5]
MWKFSITSASYFTKNGKELLDRVTVVTYHSLPKSYHYYQGWDPVISQWLSSFQTHGLSVSPVSERSLHNQRRLARRALASDRNQK